MSQQVGEQGREFRGFGHRARECVRVSEKQGGVVGVRRQPI